MVNKSTNIIKTTNNSHWNHWIQ